MPSASVLKLGQNELAQAVGRALRSAFGSESAPIKRIANAANSNERAAKNWYEGRNCPDALYLLRLIATVPELQAEVRRLTGMVGDLDPEFERDFLRLMSTYQRKRDGE